KSNTPKNIRKLFSVREEPHRLRQIGIRCLILRDQSSNLRQYVPEIEVVYLPEGEKSGTRELEHNKVTSGTQHTINFTQSPLQIFKVPHPKSNGHGIEFIFFKRYIFRISGQQLHPPGEL